MVPDKLIHFFSFVIWGILILYGTFGEGMSSDEMSSDGMFSDEMSSNGMSSDEMFRDEMFSDGMFSDEMFSDGMSSDEMSSDGMFCMGTIICVLGNYHSGIHLGGACK